MKVNQKTSFEKMVKDIHKYLQEISAVDQDFVKNPDVTVKTIKNKRWKTC